MSETTVDTMINYSDILKRMANGDTAYKIDSYRFSTPTLEDFYSQDLSPEKLKDFQDSLSSTGYNGPAFYVESPYKTEPGYYDEAKVLIVRAKAIIPNSGDEKNKIEGERELYTNAFDGDTLHFFIDSIEDSGQSITVGDSTYSSLKEFIMLNSPVSEIDNEYGKFGLRLVGVNAPEIPHYTVSPKTGTIKSFNYEDVRDDTSLYLIDKSIPRSTGDTIQFMQVTGENKWHEIVTDNYTDQKLKDKIISTKEDIDKLQINDSLKKEKKDAIDKITYCKIVSSDESKDYKNAMLGIDARDAMIELLQKAEDVLLMLDHQSLNRKSGSYPSGQEKYNDDYFLSASNIAKYPFDQIRDMWGAIFEETGYKYLGFNMYGQDVYKRFLGALYVKIPIGNTKQWVNVAKYLMSVVEKGYEVIPDYTSDPLQNTNKGFLADAFNIWSYDSQGAKIIDFLSESEFDDRREVQKQLGYDFDAVKDHTVMIGDCMFMVPPTSIRCVTQTTAERVPLLRSRGSMVKASPKSERLIEMTLYFNDDDGINGKAFETTLPAVDSNGNNKKITYYMNGLRTLVSMFKLTPFLPIENHYINKILNIEAVSLVNLQISTMVGYPRCIAASLTLQEFNYHIYMPEIPIPDRTDEDAYEVNLFAKTINFETMRWHYQRPILKGESIKNYEFTDADYIEATFGQRTALQPMKFLDSGVEFYVIDKEYLDHQLELKLEAMRKPIKTQNEVTDQMQKFAKQIANIYDVVEGIEYNDTFKNALTSLEDGLALNVYTIDDRYYQTYPGRDYPDNRINESVYIKMNSDYEITVDGTHVIVDYLDPIYNILRNALGSYSDELWMKSESKYDEDMDEFTATWTINIGVHSDMITSTEKNNFLKIMSGELSQNDGEVKNFFDKDKDAIKLIMTAKFKTTAETEYPQIDRVFELDKTSAGYKFLQLCAFNYGTAKADDEDYNAADSELYSDVTSVTMLEDVAADKQAQDYESVATFQFVKYPLGNVNIANMSCVFGNTLTRMSLKALDGFAPQYCGGQDTVIEITMQTMDENTVAQLNLLPRMAAQYMRDYRLILNCWPLRINSEITRLLGVNEVLVENVDITTVPGQPGLYNINMRLMAVDRTTRNKEALKKIEVETNAGSKTTTTAGTVDAKNFFELKEVLAKAEIYPDLELPTILDLEYNGFKFIKYLDRQKFRAYPDPDFYFVYSHILGSEIFKNSILSFTGDNASSQSEFQLSDMFSASINIVPEFKNAFSVTEGSGNAQAQSMAEQRKVIQDMIDKAIAKEKARQDAKSEINNDDIINIYNSLDSYQSWDIAENIRCMFREKKFLNAIDEDEKWFADKITAKADEIVSIIDTYLKGPIQQLDENDGIVNWNTKEYIKGINDEGDQVSKLKDAIDTQVREMFAPDNNAELARVMQILEIAMWDDKDAFGDNLSKLVGMVLAAADASSSDSEYMNKDTKEWQAKMYLNAGGVALGVLKHEIDQTLADQDAYTINDSLLTPFCKINIAEQGDTGIRFAVDLEEAMTYGTSFGPFQIRLFKKEEIKEIENTEEIIDTTEELLFLDPCYRNYQISGNTEKVDQYKRCIMMDPNIATIAFIRNFLFYLKQLVKDGVLLSLYETIHNESIQAIENNFNIIPSDGYEYFTFDSEIAEQKQAEADKKAEEQKAAIEEAKANMDDAEKEAYDAQQKEIDDAIDEQNKINEEVVKQIGNSLKDDRGPLGMGKFFAAIAMAITAGNKNISSLMKERNYDVLNQLVRGSQLPNSGSEFYVLNKFILAMVGRKAIKSIESIGTKSETATAMLGTLINEKVYIEAADDPSKYVRDSFFDMIVNDKRGRMMRAFPTYYMMLIDEGREIGLWKLHDNFYDISSISEIQVTKSRKIAADTAKIVMTNMFNSYTTDDEDSKDMGIDSEFLQNYQYTWKDVYSSIFSPRTYFLQEELKRTEQLSVEKAQIKPGIRLHLRMGYSADASELPIVFNGTIAEVGNTESIEIICQGHGIELTNPILSTSDAEDIQHADDFVVGRVFENWLTKGATPRTILGSLLTTKGGWMKKKVYKLTSGRFFNENPYGIVHFGDPQYTDIFQGGECVQNIYEASHTATFSSSAVKDYLITQYATNDVPRISSHVFGKSYWDIMNICAGASPDFITSVVPFGLRSSIFYGMPRYYYAYDYEKQNVGVAKTKAAETEIVKLKDKKDKTFQMRDKEPIQAKIDELQEKIKRYASETQTIIVEKRKPFQQFHIYTSLSDIIGNSIKVSSKDVRTCAVGLYQKQGAFGKEKMDRVDPMWVDFNIYPEKQRTMTVDTQFLAKGVPVLGDVLPFLNDVLNDISVTNGYEIAWRITARALKDSIKDMYQGELIVIGDPSVKPYDKMWIEDMSEQMQGCCEVEAVVHNFNVQDGFTTSIFADCISVIDDRHEQITQNFANNVVGKATAAYMGTAILSYIFASRSRPFLNSMAGMLAKGGSMTKEVTNSLLGILGKDELVNNEKILAKTDELKTWLGINTAGYKYDLYMRGLKNYSELLSDIDSGDVKSLAAYADHFDEMAKALNSIDPKDLISSLESAKTAAEAEGKTSKATKIGKAIDSLNIQHTAVLDKIKNNPIDLSDCIEDLKDISTIATTSGKEGKVLIDAINDLDDIIDSKSLSSVDDIKKYSKSLKTISTYVDNVDEIFTAGQIASKVAGSVSETKAILSVADDVYKAIDNAPEIAKGAKAVFASFKATLAGTIVGLVIEECISIVITGYVYEYLERWMRNLQVLQIFPLKKNGVVMTAGLDGSKGLVVGSPTEKESGLIDGWLGEVFRKGPDKSDVSNFMIDLLASQDMQEIAAKFRRRNNVPEPGTNVGAEIAVIDQLKSMAQQEMNNNSGGNNSGKMLARVTDLMTSEAKDLYKLYAIKDTSNLTMNHDIREGMVAIKCVTELKEAMDQGYLQLLHDSGDNTSMAYTTQDFLLEGDLIPITYMGQTDSSGKIIIDKKTGYPIIDLPFLRSDAILLLREIYTKVKTTFNKSTKDFATDKQIYHKMIIHSALRAGENKWTCTGFVFRVEVVDYDLKGLLEEIQVEKPNYFKAIEVKDGVFDIIVYPTSVL